MRLPRNRRSAGARSAHTSHRGSISPLYRCKPSNVGRALRAERGITKSRWAEPDLRNLTSHAHTRIRTATAMERSAGRRTEPDLCDCLTSHAHTRIRTAIPAHRKSGHAGRFGKDRSFALAALIGSRARRVGRALRAETCVTACRRAEPDLRSFACTYTDQNRDSHGAVSRASG